MAHPIAMAAQFYFSHFPVEKGKWRLWEIFRKTRYYRSFRSGAHRTRYGFSMNIQSDQQIDRVIYYWGCWEPNETDIIRKLLRPGYTFVDVGANDGYFSLLASSLVGESGKVIALEPTPDIAAELRANIHLNGFKNISVLERAASDVTGELTLTTPLGAGSGMTTFRSVAGRSWRVKADRLDVLLSDSPPPNVVEVDVEGAELKVLRGMEGLLKGEDAPHILCEVTASFLEEVGDSAGALYSLMEQLGYRTFLIEGQKLHTLPIGQHQRSGQDSVLFTKSNVSAARIW